MSKPQPRYTEDEKKIVGQQIIDTIHKICTGDATTCVFGFCIFNKHCAKPHYTADSLPKKNLKLKSLLKNVNSKFNKKVGRKNPTAYGHTLRDQIRRILGQDIEEHYLVKGDEKLKHKIAICTTLNQVNELLAMKYFKVHKKSISTPQGRSHYRKYLNENRNP